MNNENDDEKRKYLEERQKEFENAVNKQAMKLGAKEYFKDILIKILTIISVTLLFILFMYLSQYINMLYIIIFMAIAVIVLKIIIDIQKKADKYKIYKIQFYAELSLEDAQELKKILKEYNLSNEQFLKYSIEQIKKTKN